MCVGRARTKKKPANPKFETARRDRWCLLTSAEFVYVVRRVPGGGLKLLRRWSDRLSLYESWSRGRNAFWGNPTTIFRLARIPWFLFPPFPWSSETSILSERRQQTVGTLIRALPPQKRVRSCFRITGPARRLGKKRRRRQTYTLGPSCGGGPSRRGRLSPTPWPTVHECACADRTRRKPFNGRE